MLVMLCGRFNGKMNGYYMENRKKFPIKRTMTNYTVINVKGIFEQYLKIFVEYLKIFVEIKKFCSFCRDISVLCVEPICIQNYNSFFNFANKVVIFHKKRRFVYPFRHFPCNYRRLFSVHLGVINVEPKYKQSNIRGVFQKIFF